MTSSLQKEILTKLLDKYEARKDYGLPEKSNRRTILHLNKKNYPQYYHISESSFRLEFNQDAEELEKRGFIQVDWDKYSDNEVINKVYLVESSLEQVYILLERVPKREKYWRQKRLIVQLQQDTPSTLDHFYSDLIDRFEKYLPLPSIIKLDSEKETMDGINGLHGLLMNQEEIPKRNWSIKLYNDSKRWEKIQGKILHVVRDYIIPEEKHMIEDNQLMGEYGVINNPKHIQLSGNIIVERNNKEIDLSIFTPDIGLDPQFFKGCTICSLDANAIITIENLTSYNDYLLYREQKNLNEIVLYLGGYHNYGRRLILNKLKSYLADRDESIPFYHWGDIDLHGFYIWNHLRKKTGIDFQPIYMDTPTYLEHKRKGKSIKEQDVKQMMKLLYLEEYAVFHSLIEQIIEHKTILEQEAIFL